jgi:hypothetical protein
MEAPNSEDALSISLLVLNSHVTVHCEQEALYVARPQSKVPTRPTASKPYIARSDCAYVIEQ